MDDDVEIYPLACCVSVIPIYLYSIDYFIREVDSELAVVIFGNGLLVFGASWASYLVLNVALSNSGLTKLFLVSALFIVLVPLLSFDLLFSSLSIVEALGCVGVPDTLLSLEAALVTSGLGTTLTELSVNLVDANLVLEDEGIRAIILVLDLSQF